MSSSSADEAKVLVGKKAADVFVQSKSIVGLGTGSTAVHFIKRLAERVRRGELSDIKCVATSEASSKLAREEGLHVVPPEEVDYIDVAVDGADEVRLSDLAAIKGAGAALLREKLVALMAKQFVIIVDGSKVVDGLGKKMPVPVEVVKYASKHTASRIARAFPAATLKLRTRQDKVPVETDNHNYIYDVDIPNLTDVEKAATRLKSITGVVDHGLFYGLACACVYTATHGPLVPNVHRLSS